MLWLTVAMLVLSFGVNVGGIERFPGATFYSIASRAWELLVGALLACLSLRQAPPLLAVTRNPARRGLLSVAGLGAIVAACLLVKG
ncbi:acyltransferase, partial [Acinetobacter baumannii]|nr:acyltransferase [Acinetobacter baumannii]